MDTVIDDTDDIIDHFHHQRYETEGDGECVPKWVLSSWDNILVLFFDAKCLDL